VNYVEQVKRVEQILSMYDPRLREADLLVDATGVGAAICDLFDTMQLKPIRITLTAGHEATRHAPDRYSVPKIDLVASIQARLATGELVLEQKLALLPLLMEELKNFELLSRSDASHPKFGASKGHDDLPMALGLCTWWTTSGQKLKPGGTVGVQPLIGLY
jgi:hypothetical protein